ncbi:MAG TPA: molybdate ABC transporter substrate-binding protein [Pyrinomonadaceae bacterium]|jgi:molybdate transport system substrate-binding protein
MKVRLLFILFVFVFVCCRTNSSDLSNNSSEIASNLTVSAAVSLKDAFNEIGELYKSKSGKNVNFNFGASGALQKQIETGAPVGLFASAGEKQMDELAEKDLIDVQSRLNFARNTLVLAVPQDSKLNIREFSDLSGSEISKIAIGNPKTVPAGQYTEQFFERNNLKNSLQQKLILAEDVRQVLDYVVRGEVDAGIVYATDARVAGEKVHVAATAPNDSHAPILYPIAIIKDSAQKQSAQDFINLVLSAEGQAVLQKYGFIGANGK